MQNYNPKFKSDLRSRCYKFSLDTIRFIEKNNLGNTSKIMANQLLRSATSVGANLVEGKSASSRLEFKKFYEISLKSANETKYWLYLLRDSDSIQSDGVAELITEIEELSRMLAVGVMKLKAKTLQLLT